MKQIQTLLQEDVINGFSYSFTQALLDKLKGLKAEGRVFKKEENENLDPDCFYNLTDIANAVIENLRSQLFGSNGWNSSVRPSEIESLISTAEEFLEALSIKETDALNFLKDPTLSFILDLHQKK